ncbi:hypothetical protein QJQ45_027925 [Haematococcus lacustris]|nr:hypothetical protein QJQ45_027925 [Haematococcus lacustris]
MKDIKCTSLQAKPASLSRRLPVQGRQGAQTDKREGTVGAAAPHSSMRPSGPFQVVPMHLACSVTEPLASARAATSAAADVSSPAAPSPPTPSPPSKPHHGQLRVPIAGAAAGRLDLALPMHPTLLLLVCIRLGQPLIPGHQGGRPAACREEATLHGRAWSKRFEAPVRSLMWCPKLDQATPGDIGKWVEFPIPSLAAGLEPAVRGANAGEPGYPWGLGRLVDRDCNLALAGISQFPFLPRYSLPQHRLQPPAPDQSSRPLSACRQHKLPECSSSRLASRHARHQAAASAQNRHILDPSSTQESSHLSSWSVRNDYEEAGGQTRQLDQPRARCTQGWATSGCETGHPRPSSMPRDRPDPSNAADIVETVASLALRSRLRACDSIRFHVNANSLGLLQGRVQAVTMVGTGWQSPAGLSARLLQAQVGPTELDFGAVLVEQRIRLRQPPEGSARCLFTADDFAQFLAHPLLTRAAATAVQGLPVAFCTQPGSVKVVCHTPAAALAASPTHRQHSSHQHSSLTRSTWSSSSGNYTGQQQQEQPTPGWEDATRARQPGVWFTAAFQGVTYELCMQPCSHASMHLDVAQGPRAHSGEGNTVGPRPSPTVKMTAHPVPVASHRSVVGGQGDLGAVPRAAEVEAFAQGLAHFFNTLLLDLQGVELSFAGLAILTPEQGASVVDRARGAGVRTGAVESGRGGILDLHLKLRVRDFPPLNVEF